MTQEFKETIQKEKFYSPVEIAKILWVKNQTITNAIKSWNLIASNIGAWHKRANYKITWLSLLAWLDNYSDLETLLKFIDFYTEKNDFDEVKQTILNYFDNKI